MGCCQSKPDQEATRSLLDKDQATKGKSVENVGKQVFPPAQPTMNKNPTSGESSTKGRPLPVPKPKVESKGTAAPNREEEILRKEREQTKREEELAKREEQLIKREELTSHREKEAKILLGNAKVESEKREQELEKERAEKQKRDDELIAFYSKKADALNKEKEKINEEYRKHQEELERVKQEEKKKQEELDKKKQEELDKKKQEELDKKKQDERKRRSERFLSWGLGSKDVKIETEPEISIGGPSNFRHEAHVGFDPEKGFNLRNVPDEWNRLISKAGVTEEQLQDKETASFIVSFVASALESKGTPTEKPSQDTTTTPTSQTVPSPSIKEDKTQDNTGKVPPQKDLGKKGTHDDKEPIISAPTNGPPPPSGDPATYVPPAAPGEAPKPDRGSLERTNTEGFLDAIKQGKRLKKVTTAPKLELTQEDENSMAKALRSALEAREKYLADSSEDEDQHGEWV